MTVRRKDGLDDGDVKSLVADLLDPSRLVNCLEVVPSHPVQEEGQNS